MSDNTDIVQINTNLAASEWIAKRNTALAAAKSVTQVDSNEELEIAGAVEADLKKLVKKLEAMRKEVTAPIDELKKSIVAKEKLLAADLQKEITRVNAMTTAYANELARRAAEEQAAREAAEREAAEREAAGVQSPEDVFGLPTAPIPVPTVTAPPRTSSNKFVEVWDFEITNPRAVPIELCTPDEKKIRAFMQAKKADGYKADQLSVAGIKFTSSVKVYSK